MSTRIITTQEGNLGRDPDFGVADNGTHWARFSLGVTDRVRNPQTNEWSDGTTVFHQVTAFGKLADNIRDTLRRGDRAIVTGSIEPRAWIDKETGKARAGTEIVADTVGASLRYRSASISREAAKPIPERSAPQAGALRTVEDWPTARPGSGGVVTQSSGASDAVVGSHGVQDRAVRF